LNLSSIVDEKRFDFYWAQNLHITVNQLVTVPIFDANFQIIGVAKAVNKKNHPCFSTEDLVLLRAFASFAGLAIDRWKYQDLPNKEIELIDKLSPSELNTIDITESVSVFEPLLSNLSSNGFDVLKVDFQDMQKSLLYFISKLGIIQKFKISIGTFLRFISDTCKKCKQIPFHDWDNTVSITQYLFLILSIDTVYNIFSPLEIFSFLTASVCHASGRDEQIMVVDRQFPLLILFKDQTVLETAHCYSAINLISLPKSNIVSQLNEE
jgi:hypothetical protein